MTATQQTESTERIARPLIQLAKLNGGRPLVLLDACEETPTVDAVNFPNEEGERAAMQYLIAQGPPNVTGKEKN